MSVLKAIKAKSILKVCVHYDIQSSVFYISKYCFIIYYLYSSDVTRHGIKRDI